MKNKLKSESGAALVIALSVLAMLSVVGIIAVQTSNTDMELSHYKTITDKSFYAADAGAKRAIMEVIYDPDWDIGYTKYPIGTAFYTVVVTNSSSNPALADSVIITSTGMMDGARSTIEVIMAPEIIKPYEHAMFGRNSIDIRNSMKTDSYNSDSGTYWTTRNNIGGNLGSNGSIIIKNGATIGGNVTTSSVGSLNIHDSTDVLGDILEIPQNNDIPDIRQIIFDIMEANNDNLTGLSGSYSYDANNHSFLTTESVTFDGGVYYFSDFVLKNSASIIIAPQAKTEVYISGAVTIKNSGTINAGGNPDNLILFIKNDFALDNSAEMRAVIYAPSANINLRNSADYYGAVVANNLTCNNSSTYHYDRRLENISYEGGASIYRPIAWREI